MTVTIAAFDLSLTATGYAGPEGVAVLAAAELHYTERGVALARYPGTKAGKSQAAGMNRSLGHDVSETVSPTFAADTAAKTGDTPRTVQHDVQIAHSFDPAERQILKDRDIPKRDAGDPYELPDRPQLSLAHRAALESVEWPALAVR